MSAKVVHAYLRALLEGKDATERVGPFTIGYSLRSEMPYMNYAVPDDDAGPTMGEVQALVATFAGRGRRARLEYIPSLAPAVEEMLLQAGFVEEGRYPLMFAVPTGVADGLVSDTWDTFRLTPDDGVEEYVSAVHRAFGAEPTSRDFDNLRDRLRRGTRAVGLRRRSDGLVVGGGELTPVIEGVTELAGVGVLADARRNGAGLHIVRSLLALAPEIGAHTIFLMAAGEAEQRIYARAGFETGGEVLHISIPAL